MLSAHPISRTAQPFTTMPIYNPVVKSGELEMTEDVRNVQCAVSKTRSIRRNSIGLRGFRGENKGMIWTSMEEPSRPH